MSEPGYRQLDHTADLAYEVWASNEAQLLDIAARALVETMTSAEVRPDDTRAIALDDALDREDRLVRFLNEVIFLAVNEGFVVHSAELTLEGETGLSGRLFGCNAPLLGELKAVTYHDLSLTLGDPCRAVFVVDV